MQESSHLARNLLARIRGLTAGGLYLAGSIQPASCRPSSGRRRQDANATKLPRCWCSEGLPLTACVVGAPSSALSSCHRLPSLELGLLSQETSDKLLKLVVSASQRVFRCPAIFRNLQGQLQEFPLYHILYNLSLQQPGGSVNRLILF